jgi:hypothetical protein
MRIHPAMAATEAPPVMEARRWISGISFPADRPLLNVSQAAPVAPHPKPCVKRLRDLRSMCLRRICTGRFWGWAICANKWRRIGPMPTADRWMPWTLRSRQGAIRLLRLRSRLWPEQGMKFFFQNSGTSITKCGLIWRAFNLCRCPAAQAYCPTPRSPPV